MTKDIELTNALNRLTEVVMRMTPPIPAIPAINPIMPIPAIPAIPQIVNTTDHDTLVAFRAETVAELKNIRIDIATLNDGTTKRLNDLETRMKVAETGLTKLMAYGTVLVFLVGIAQIFIGKWIK